MPEAEKRFLFIDGIRGIAIIWLACFHFYYGAYGTGLNLTYPFSFLNQFFSSGRLAIIIFFFISGFVVAYRSNAASLTYRFFSFYPLRRLVRLLLPYWAAIAVFIILSFLENCIVRSQGISLLNAAVIIKNVFFLQIFSDTQEIVAGSWFIFTELIFYLLFILLFGLMHYVMQRSKLQFSAVFLIIFSPLAILSLVETQVFRLPDFVRVLLLPYWYVFVAGALVAWVLHGMLPKYFLGIFVFLASSGLLLKQWERWKIMIMALVMCALFYCWGRYLQQRDFLSNRIVQYFGKISYSFYLLHMIVGLSVFRIILKVWGSNAAPFYSGFLPAFIACTIAAQLLYMLVERPSTNLSKHIT